MLNRSAGLQGCPVNGKWYTNSGPITANKLIKSVHNLLEPYRDSKQKEFFRAPAKIVIKAMQKVEEEMTR